MDEIVRIFEAKCLPPPDVLLKIVRCGIRIHPPAEVRRKMRPVVIPTALVPSYVHRAHFVGQAHWPAPAMAAKGQDFHPPVLCAAETS